MDVGLAPNPNGRYVVYTHHTKPSVALKLHGPSKPPDKHTSALDLLVKEVEVEPCDFCDETACRALFDEMDAGAAWEDSSDGEGAMEAEAEGKSGGDGEAKGKSGDGDGGDSVGGNLLPAAAVVGGGGSGSGSGDSGAQSPLTRLLAEKLANGETVYAFLRHRELITRSGHLTDRQVPVQPFQSGGVLVSPRFADSAHRRGGLH